jgi:hypothetical protein
VRVINVRFTEEMMQVPNVAKRITLSLTLSSAFSFIFVSIFLSIYASSQPSTLMFRLVQWTETMIGHSGRDWFLAYFAAFTIPTVAIVESLPRSLTSSMSFSRFCAVSGFFAVPISYVVHRSPVELQDLVILFPASFMLLATLMQGFGKWPAERKLLVAQVVMYFAFFGWFFYKYFPLPDLIVVPLLAMTSCVLWALDAPIRVAVIQSDRT